MKNKNLKRLTILNPRGFAPHFILLLVVVAVAGVGTYLQVAGHAATKDTPYNRTEREIQHTPAGTPERIVKIAKQQLGYAEKPVNKVKFFQWAGDRPGAPGPWCSVFATWVWHASGVDLYGQPYPMQPGVRQVRDTGKRDGRFHTTNPQPGDAILYGPEGSDHIGIVIKASRSSVTVIEGNSGLDGQLKKYVIKRRISLKNPKNVPHGVVYGYVSPPSPSSHH